MSSISLPAEFPPGFQPLPADLVAEYPSQYSEIEANLKAHSSFYPEYQANRIPRLIVVSIVVVSVAALFLVPAGFLANFPAHLTTCFQNVSWIHIGASLGATAILAGGVALVFNKVLNQEDRVTKTGIGKLAGDDHWVCAKFACQNPRSGFVAGHIDQSTLDATGSGVCFLYGHKPEGDHYAVSICVTLVTPFHMLASMAYHTVRAVLIPFYMLGCMCVESIRGEKLYSSDRFIEVHDILKETGFSIWGIVRSPFYALAQMCAALYSLVDPLNGRKLGAEIERDWNWGLTRSEGFWSVNGAQALFRYHVWKNAFFVAGCWQPFAVVYYRNHEIINATSLSKAINPSRGKDYLAITREALRQYHNSQVDEIKELEQRGSLVNAEVV